MKNFKKILLVAVALFVNDSFGMMMSSVQRYLVPMVTCTLWNKHYSMQIIFARRNFSNVRSIKDVNPNVIQALKKVTGDITPIEYSNGIVEKLNNAKIRCKSDIVDGTNIMFSTFDNVSFKVIKDFFSENFINKYDTMRTQHLEEHFYTEKSEEAVKNGRKNITKNFHDVFVGDLDKMKVESMLFVESNESDKTKYTRKITIFGNFKDKVTIQQIPNNNFSYTDTFVIVLKVIENAKNQQRNKSPKLITIFPASDKKYINLK